MPPTKSSNENLAARIKKDMVNYIGPIFQELKCDIKELESKLTGRIIGLEERTHRLEERTHRLEESTHRLEESTHRLEENTHRLGILMEDMRSEVRTALEASSSVLKHEDIVRDHQERIVNLERDVRVLIKVSKT